MVFFSHREARIKITASHEQVREELSSAIAEIGTCNEGSARLSATITDLETSVGPTQCAMHWCLGGKESHCRVVPHYFSYKCFSLGCMYTASLPPCCGPIPVPLQTRSSHSVPCSSDGGLALHHHPAHTSPPTSKRITSKGQGFERSQHFL